MSSQKPVTAAERLKLLRKRLGKTQSEMAGLLQISIKGYQRYERGEYDIPAATVDRAREQLGVNPRWLLDDIGEMFLADAPGPEAARIRRSLGLEPPGARELMQRMETAGTLVDRLMVEHSLPQQPTLREALRAVAAVDGVRLDHLAFLSSAIAELLRMQTTHQVAPPKPQSDQPLPEKPSRLFVEKIVSRMINEEGKHIPYQRFNAIVDRVYQAWVKSRQAPVADVIRQALTEER